MKLTSILAIYALFWVLSAFLVMPFGVRTHEEAGVAKVPGQADSAPVEFRPMRVAVRATILAAVLFSLYYVNYVEGWLTMSDINPFSAPNIDGSPHQLTE
jgi:predicted secreted protein